MTRYLRFFFLLSIQFGEGAFPGREDFQESADVVGAVLSRYSRPFTFLGIGQDLGSSVAKSALVYPESIFVVLDQTPGDETTLSSQANAVWLNHQLLFEEAQGLASCEHVDVLLLSHSLQQFGEKWKEALQAFQQMSHVVIIALPQRERNEASDAMHNYLSQCNGSIYEGASSTYYLLEEKASFRLIRTTLIHPRKTCWAYEGYCDYDRKVLRKIRPDWTAMSSWLPGINMMTYLMLNGAIPSRSQLLARLPLDPEHSDWAPNNMIIQGSHILLIDKDDPVSTPVMPDGGERFRDMEAKMRAFISTTSNMSPPQVREAFISIYNWGTYFDQTEIDE